MEGFTTVNFASAPKEVTSAISGSGNSSTSESVEVKNAVNKESQPQKWLLWGDDNQLGVKYRDLVEGNPVLNRAIVTLGQVLASGGLQYGSWNAEKESNVRSFNEQIEDWLDSFDSDNFLNEVSYELAHFNMAYVRVILTKDRKKVARIFVDETLNIRYKKPANYEQGAQPTHVYLYGSWDKTPSDSDLAEIALLDPYRPLAEQFANSTDTNYIYPIRGQNSGRTFYAVPHWFSAEKAEWISISSSIAKFKKALMKNMAVIKQHIEIDIDYWQHAVPNWDSLSDVEKKQKIDAKVTSIGDFLAGDENAGKAFVSYVKSLGNGEKIGINFKEVAHKLLDGTFIEDSAEANTHILFAAGVDATVIGTIPGKGQGAGSGSDKREAFNIMVTTNGGMQRAIAKLITKCAKFNGYKEQFWIANSYLQTLDKVTPSKRNAQ